MIDIDNQTTYTINEKNLEHVLSTLTQKDIELIVTSNAHIKEINKQHRSIDKPTDVLSFPYEDMPMAPLGSIMISADYVKNKAQELGHSEDDEFTLLFIHGVLHLLGYDHECDSGEMRAMEEKLIVQLGLPKSLIVRTEGE
jgi:probable rRNA maturation factor